MKLVQRANRYFVTTLKANLGYQAWLAIKVAAKRVAKTIYQIVKELWSDFYG